MVGIGSGYEAYHLYRKPMALDYPWAGANDTYAPEKKPKKIANTMIATFEVAMIQRARTRNPVM